ncbi:MAG: hypothetical protein IJA87_01225 [Clostridia bacterium]|nr:hypothetical protein [Clostridia bacterium]
MKSKISRRILVAICIAALVTAAAIVTTHAAAPAPAFTVNSASQLRPGDEVTINVSVNNNRGYCAGEFILGYDSDVLTPISVESGEAASEYFVSNKAYTGNEVYFAVIDEELMTDGGTLASVTFKVSENVVLYSGDLTLSVPTLVGNISVGYGLNNVKSTANGGKIYAAKQIFVPDAVNPSVNEELSIKAASGSYVLGASTYANLTHNAIAKNFTSLATKFTTANGTMLPANSLLTTGCKVIVTDTDNTSNTLTVSVKGDVDGNCSKDANDAFLVGMFESGLLTEDDIGTAYKDAADLNGDGKVDDTDFELAVNAPLK